MTTILLIDFNGPKDLHKLLTKQFREKECPIKWASENGHIELVNYIANPIKVVDTEDAIKWASEYGYLELTDRVTNSVGTEDAIRLASENGHIELVHYIARSALDDQKK